MINESKNLNVKIVIIALLKNQKLMIILDEKKYLMIG